MDPCNNNDNLGSATVTAGRLHFTIRSTNLHAGEGQQVLRRRQPAPPELLVEQRPPGQEHERHPVDAQQVVAVAARLPAADRRCPAQMADCSIGLGSTSL